eukprot:Tamp_06832.p1 GENE.Tamp_06832~~Tamp_06832.p1  ORF type:complete len:820 (+),score=155.99 Tamp_06832:361-2460(+)
MQSLGKLVAIARAGGEPCANQPEGGASLPRDEPCALALIVVTLSVCLVNVRLLCGLSRMIKRDKQMSSIMRDIEANTSSGGGSSRHTQIADCGSGAGEKEDEPAPPNVQQLIDRARPEACWLLAGCLVLMIRLPFSLSLPHFVSETISALILKDFEAARSNITFFCGAGIVDAALDFWCVFLFGFTQQRLVRSLRIDLFRSLLSQDMAFFDAASSGEITSRLTSDCAEMANDLTWVFRFTIEALVRIGGITSYMFYRSWRLALLACSVIPVVAVVNRFYGAWMAENAKKVQSALADANSVAQEVLSAMRTVFSFAGEARELDRYSSAVQRHYKLNVRQTAISGLYYMGCCTFLMNMCVQAALLMYGSHLIFIDLVTADTLLAFMLYQGQLQEYFGNLLNSFTNLLKSAGAGAKVFKLLRRRPRIRRDGQMQIADVVGALSFDQVNFGYASREGQAALTNLTLHVHAGEMVAFVGPSGAGKSTILHMLQHFYEPLSGSVCLDGVDVQALDHAWLHNVIAMVGQEPVLFAGTIESNILYGLWHDHETVHASSSSPSFRQRVVAAATIANAHGFVSALPDGYNTSVGEKGVQLSGGQRQRVAIARAIVRNPKVLLLDEATSALDSESEALVQSALEKAMEGRTVLVVAHRLSTVARADRIAFLHQGRLLECGSHQDLMHRPLPDDGTPSYRQLLDRQRAALE